MAFFSFYFIKYFFSLRLHSNYKRVYYIINNMDNPATRRNRSGEIHIGNIAKPTTRLTYPLFIITTRVDSVSSLLQHADPQIRICVLLAFIFLCIWLSCRPIPSTNHLTKNTKMPPTLFSRYYYFKWKNSVSSDATSFDRISIHPARHVAFSTISKNNIQTLHHRT